jgi:hypothetical protein
MLSSLAGKGGMMASEGAQSGDPDLKAWKKAIGEKGWATPTWPTEYGGGGLTPQQARVLGQEMAKAGAFNPLTFGMGITMLINLSAVNEIGFSIKANGQITTVGFHPKLTLPTRYFNNLDFSLVLRR